MIRRLLFAAPIVLWFLGSLCGCGGTGQPNVQPSRLDKGLVIVLTGVHGRLWLSESICQGLDQGGVDQAIEIYDWTYHGQWLPFYNLGAVERNHRMARQISAHVQAYQKDHPGRPVTLVGYSGGGPLAIWTAEALPKDVHVDGLILLCTPLVPEYDLRPALSASRKGIMSFYSPRDRIYLAMGTLLFGTMDKRHRVSAGNLGFFDPRKSDASGSAASAPAEYDVYDKLYQVAWQPEMAQYGYDGMHLTIGAKDFVAAYLAPLVKARRWDARLVDQLPEAPPAGGPTTAPAAASPTSRP
jgi:pimeloyl-ACP methyl ester carboxylesterase